MKNQKLVEKHVKGITIKIKHIGKPAKVSGFDFLKNYKTLHRRHWVNVLMLACGKCFTAGDWSSVDTHEISCLNEQNIG